MPAPSPRVIHLRSYAFSLRSSITFGSIGSAVKFDWNPLEHRVRRSKGLPLVVHDWWDLISIGEIESSHIPWDRVMHKDDCGHECAYHQACDTPNEQEDRETFEASGRRSEELLKFFLSTLHFLLL